jgi:hypothetical protein
MHQRCGWLQEDPCDEPYFGCMDCGKPVFVAKWARKYVLTIGRRNVHRIVEKILS